MLCTIYGGSRLMVFDIIDLWLSGNSKPKCYVNVGWFEPPWNYLTLHQTLLSYTEKVEIACTIIRETETLVLVENSPDRQMITPIRGLSTIFKKNSWDLVYPADFWDTREIREIWLVVLGDWNLNRTQTFHGKSKPWIGVLIESFECTRHASCCVTNQIYLKTRCH